MPYIRSKKPLSMYNLKRNLTLRFGVLLLLFLVLYGVSFVFTKSAVDTKENDSVIINLAGRHRMLVQKFATDSTLVLVGLAVSDWKLALEKKKTASQTADILEQTHSALMNGGNVRIITIQENLVNIPRIESPIVQKHLGHVEDEWEELKRISVLAFRSDVKSLAHNTFITQIQKKASEVIHEMECVTFQLQTESEARLRGIMTLQVIMIGIGISLFFGIMVFVYLKIVTPLDRSDKEIHLRNKQLSSEIVERKQSASELTERNQLLSLSSGVGNAVVNAVDTKTMLENCVTLFVKILDVAFARIWRLNKDEQVLELQASAGMYTHIDGPHSRVTVGKLKIGLIAQECKPYMTNSVVGDHRVGNQEWAKREGMVSFAGYPLMLGGALNGVLAVFAKHSLSDAMLDGMSSVSNAIALGIERRNTEASLRDSMENALRANRAKSIFLSSMSHELRTPMNSILGFAQLLDSDSVGSLSESQKQNVKYILKSGNHLLELINEVLDLSGIESSVVKITLESVEIDTAINDAITSVEQRADESSIKVNFLTESGAQYIMADNTRLKQILINLLTNAIKYNIVGGSVTIWVESPTDKILRINIKDTGPGIPKEKHDVMFEPFNRLGVEALNIEGTGIGLTITKRLVEMMGGSIGVESEERKGAKFYVDFKKAVFPVIITDKNEDAVVEENEAEIIKRYTMLYVEDNPANLKLVESILQRRPNISLLSASQAQPGIELARSHQPNIILMDINLPDMDGYEALKLLECYDDTKNIPVIAISANAMPKDIERGKSAGFKDYVTKPINVNKFLEVVDKELLELQ